MVMPSWHEFMVPVLRVLEDGQTRQRRDLFEAVAAHVGLTAEQREERFTSGEPRYTNRIGWAQSYLDRVGAIRRPARGVYEITDLGRQLLATHPTSITEKDLRQYAREGDEWWANSTKDTATSVVATSDMPVSELDPKEQIEAGITAIESDVAAELLTRLHGNEPAFFEKAVLDLLIAMGYGGTEGRATRTQLSNDGGIDGIVDQDALGLSRIYVQAKRYALDASVGRPEIQGFVGALHGNQANQGVFITTGRFSRGATEYAAGVASRVILIDGRRLAYLMIRYGVGVQVKRTLHIVDIDEDFFE
ncbi:restriction endonuclease [Nocardioides sp. NBC_00368]|uniref:restriction endonuclease n=1 Tax=Nocardioides sp. NBC_00368 TaxID=2976000 RepID=UPI002E238F74